MTQLTASRAPNSKNAYVTLMTGEGYLPGVIALARSIKLSGTKADIVVMHRDGVSDEAFAALAEFDCRMVHVPALELSEGFKERHERGRVHKINPFSKGRKPTFHTPLDNFCKLRLWQLTEYNNCIFVDGDALVLRNIDRLFDYPEFAAAPNVYETLIDFHRLNSGVFTAKPSEATFDAMMKSLDQPDAFWRRTDQTFLESYFPNWHGLPVFFNMLQYVWFNMPALWDWKSVHVVHFQYEKPWEKDHPKADMLRPLIELWDAYYTGDNIPNLAQLSNPPAER